MENFSITKNFLGVRFPFKIQTQQMITEQGLQVYVESLKPALMVKHFHNNPQTIRHKLLLVATEAAHQINSQYILSKILGITHYADGICLRAVFHLN